MYEYIEEIVAHQWLMKFNTSWKYEPINFWQKHVHGVNINQGCYSLTSTSVHSVKFTWMCKLREMQKTHELYDSRSGFKDQII